MNKLIKTETDHDEALAKLKELMLENPDEGTARADELELLAHLIEVYESKVVNIPSPSPIEGSDASTCSVSNSDTPETDDSTERAIEAGISPIIDYCYALDMQKMEIERNEAREQAEIFRDAFGEAHDCTVTFSWEL